MKMNVYDFPDRKVIEEEAGEWLIKLDGDTPLSFDERQVLREWLGRSARHKVELSALAEFWGKMNVLTELTVPIGKHEPQTEQVLSDFVNPGLFNSRRVILMAAVVTLTFVIAFTVHYMPNSRNGSNGLYATVVGQQQSIALADGSFIQLNTNSQIKVDYNDHFRNIYLLQGEGHFSVAKNADLPFRVYAGDGMIQAIGTAFSVHLQARDVSITVTEGRVSLAAVDDAKTTQATGDESKDLVALPNDVKINNLGILAAGQSTTMKRRVLKESIVETSLDPISTIELPELERRLSWRKGLLIYAGEPLQEVVAEISRYTDVSIEIMDAEVGAIKIGGQFRVGETDAMFDVLEENFGLRVKRLSNNHVQLFAALE